MKTEQISGNIVNIQQRDIYPGIIDMANGKITAISKTNGPVPDRFILPGFIDAHVHIESSMLVPSEFARIAVCHGTVATVSDPHEIANVLGVDGVDYMIDNGNTVPFHFFFGAPSCVPATSYETSGAIIDSSQIAALLQRPEILYLSEMMNYPGVLHGDPEVLAKLNAARQAGKPIDGHAPGLAGDAAVNYIRAGITTDHECYTLEEARFKASHGMKIAIREGSAARNFNELIPLIREYPGQIMFCSDDKHPDDLMKGHIDRLVAGAVSMGYDLFDILQAACITPVEHYNLPLGLLRPGDPADFIIVTDLTHFKHQATHISGQKVAEFGRPLMGTEPAETPNQFFPVSITADDIALPAQEGDVRCIKALDGLLITESIEWVPRVENGWVVADTQRDILKLVVINRYRQAPPAIGLIHGFGLKEGALASTVAHDSHNIIAVGTDDESIARAVNTVAKHGGGIAAVGPQSAKVLPLPVAGLMSIQDAATTAGLYEEIDLESKKLGSQLRAPFMTLSFMALLVIPSLKLSDQGLFDGHTFKFKTLFTG